MNSYQTVFTDEDFKALPKEVKAEFYDLLENVPFIKWLTQPEEIRGFAKDRPKDEIYGDGRILVDITRPHILEDMDFFRERALYFQEHGRYTDIPPNPNTKSEWGRFWKEEQYKWKYGVVRESDGEWIPGSYYFYLNYAPIWQVKEVMNTKTGRTRGERFHDFPKPWLGDYLFFHYQEQALRQGSHSKIIKCRGVGFEQPNSEIVKTFEGDKLVGEVKVGDRLIGIDGKETKVLEVYPQGIKDVYEVEFIDGRKVKCGLDHLWYVRNLTKKRLDVVKLSEMIEKGLYWKINGGKNKMYKYKLPKPSPVEYLEKQLPIDPYVLGILLGDGALTGTSIRVATNDTFVIEELGRLLEGYTFIKDPTSNNYIIKTLSKFEVTKEDLEKYGNSQFGLNRLKREIRNLGLEVDTKGKFIPQMYKLSSITQRISLLQGLMDSDGYVSEKGNYEFTNSNYQLIKDVADVAGSLGYRCKLAKGRPPRKKIIRGKEANIRQEYRLHIITNDVIVRLPRKVERCRKVQIFEESAVINITKLNYQEESTCFLVDNDTHTYLTTDYVPTHNSFKMASLSPRNMYIYPGTGNPNFHLASDSGFLTGDKGIWGKILDNLDWIADNTPLPRLRAVDRRRGILEVQLGYDDKYGVRRGLQTSVTGISLKDNPDKARGLRGVLIHYEEDGLFPNLETAWNINRSAVEDGGVTFGLMCSGGTGGTVGADFAGSERLFYNPEAYNIYGVPNVYDKNSSGLTKVGFFWGSYLNRNGCYDLETGEPDVTKALLEILIDRAKIRASAPDSAAITQNAAENATTPQEAVMRVDGTMFPVADLKEYLGEIMVNELGFTNSHFIGELVWDGKGGVTFVSRGSLYPIRDFPALENKTGAVEIYELPMPKKIDYRYIIGVDTYDDDVVEYSSSLGSAFVFDRWTRRIVAEFTGRPSSANAFYEIVHKLAVYYNATIMYESNKKGLFTYFNHKSALTWLADTPEILSDKQTLRPSATTNTSKGINATAAINSYGLRLQSDWMLERIYSAENKEDEEDTVYIPNYKSIRSIGYLKEAIAWHNKINADRVSAMNMVMIYDAELEQYSFKKESANIYRRANDSFFDRAYSNENSYSMQDSNFFYVKI